MTVEEITSLFLLHKNLDEAVVKYKDVSNRTAWFSIELSLAEDEVIKCKRKIIEYVGVMYRRYPGYVK